MVEGPPGIGKSSLLAAARALARDLRVLSARGGELEREFPFGIVRQLLEPVVLGATRRSAARCSPTPPRWPARCCSRRTATPSPSPRSPPCTGCSGSTVNLAGSGPLLAVVDDVQWADLASLRWLVYLARRLEGVPLALLLAARPAETGSAQELLDELAAVAEVTVLYPGDLSEPAVGRLVPGGADPEFVTGLPPRYGRQPVPARASSFGEIARA